MSGSINRLNPDGTIYAPMYSQGLVDFGTPPTYPAWLTDLSARGIGSDWAPDARVDMPPIKLDSREIPQDEPPPPPPPSVPPGGAVTPLNLTGGGADGGSGPDASAETANSSTDFSGLSDLAQGISDMFGGLGDNGISANQSGNDPGQTGDSGDDQADAGSSDSTSGDMSDAGAAGPGSGDTGAGAGMGDAGASGSSADADAGAGSDAGAGAEGGGGGEADGGDGGGGGEGDSRGGIITRNKLMPNGPKPSDGDDGWASIAVGEGVISRAAMKHYGPAFLAAINKLAVPNGATR